MNHHNVLIARNRTRRQHKVYLYEAEMNMLSKFGSVSDTVHAIVAAFLKKTGHDMSFLKERDHNKIKEIRRAIKYNT
jgi:hypothetical protein